MHSWTQTTSGYEDMYTQHTIPTLITWSYGGKDVSVQGSWDNWKSRFSFFLFKLHYLRELCSVVHCFLDSNVFFCQNSIAEIR